MDALDLLGHARKSSYLKRAPSKLCFMLFCMAVRPDEESFTGSCFSTGAGTGIVVGAYIDTDSDEPCFALTFFAGRRGEEFLEDTSALGLRAFGCDIDFFNSS